MSAVGIRQNSHCHIYFLHPPPVNCCCLFVYITRHGVANCDISFVINIFQLIVFINVMGQTLIDQSDSENVETIPYPRPMFRIRAMTRPLENK